VTLRTHAPKEKWKEHGARDMDDQLSARQVFERKISTTARPQVRKDTGLRRRRLSLTPAYVEDPCTALTRDDLISTFYLKLYLGPQMHIARRARTVDHLSASDAVAAALGQPVIDRGKPFGQGHKDVLPPLALT